MTSGWHESRVLFKQAWCSKCTSYELMMVNPLTYVQPNNVGEEDCVVATTTGGWNDYVRCVCFCLTMCLSLPLFPRDSHALLSSAVVAVRVGSSPSPS